MYTKMWGKEFGIMNTIKAAAMIAAVGERAVNSITS
jgi:hypothetical protein